MKKAPLVYKICFLFIGMCWFCALAWAQQLKPTIVQGNAAFATGCEIRLVAYSDLLSYRQQVIATDKIDRKGNFKLVATIAQTQLVQIAIQTSKAELYLQPEHTYNLSIEMDSVLFQQFDPMNYGGFLQIRSSDQRRDLNYQINHFEQTAAQLIDYFAPNIIGDMSAAEFDTITTELQKQFSLQYQPTHFVHSYIYYYYANLESVIRHKSPDSLYKKYLDNEYILYNNPAYMSFLQRFYDHYFIQSRHIGTAELVRNINEEGTYRALFNLVGKDPLLVNEKIREIVMLENLYELIDNKAFNKKNIQHIIQEIALTSHFEEHRLMAENMLYLIEKNNGQQLLEMPKLKEIGGSSFHFSDWTGKWVYVQFFNLACTDCVREMMIIKELQKKYKDNITFVSLSVDFSLSHLLQFKERFPQFDWLFVHFNDQYAWLDALEIRALPDNILISPEGKIAQRHAPDISRDLSQFLQRLFAPEEQLNQPLDPHNRN